MSFPERHKKCNIIVVVALALCAACGRSPTAPIEQATRCAGQPVAIDSTLAGDAKPCR